MGKKILMSVEMRCEKCRTKALQIVAGADGVKYLGLEGEKQDQVAVIGDNNFDAAAIVLRLRKKLGRTKIISVTNVKP